MLGSHGKNREVDAVKLIETAPAAGLSQSYQGAERERERDRQTDRQTDRDRQRQTDRETERQTERVTVRDRERDIDYNDGNTD